MSDEPNPAPEHAETSAIDYYKSLDVAHRDVEAQLLEKAMEVGIAPESVRYGIFRDNYRGAVRAVDKSLYYFNWPPKGSIRFVPADTVEKSREAEYLIKACTLGCDLIKSEKAPDEEDESEKKAGPAGGGAANLPPASQPEAQATADQATHFSDTHPGATVAQTPESPGASERWHGAGHLERALPPIDPAAKHDAWTTNDLLKAWGQHWQRSAPGGDVDPQQKKFMVEVLGASPSDIDSGRAQLNSAQRAQYNQWLTRSLRGRLGGLQDWLAKSKGDGTT